MPVLPGGGDWTRSEESAKAVIEDRLNNKPPKKQPLKEKITKILFRICIVTLAGYAIWDFLLKQ